MGTGCPASAAAADAVPKQPVQDSEAFDVEAAPVEPTACFGSQDSLASSLTSAALDNWVRDSKPSQLTGIMPASCTPSWR